MVEPICLPKKLKGVRKRATDQKKDVLISRLWHSAEQQIAELEKRLSHKASVGSERDARSLVILVKVLRELILLDAEVRCSLENGLPSGDLASSYSGSLSNSFNVDQLRQILAERLAHLGSGGENTTTPEPL